MELQNILETFLEYIQDRETILQEITYTTKIYKNTVVELCEYYGYRNVPDLKMAVHNSGLLKSMKKILITKGLYVDLTVVHKPGYGYELAFEVERL